jgi:fructokinase
MLQFGIDLGGTKTELIVLRSDGHTALRERLATPAHSYDAILETIVTLVDQAQLRLNVQAQALGVGAPGTPFGPEGRLKNANTTCLINQRLADDLSARLSIPVVVENDANCLVLSEATDGAGAGATMVFGVILGTGVGGGLAVNGQLLNGPNRITGEWGHNPLPRWFGMHASALTPRDCYCGLQDCIETYLSGSGLKQTYLQICDSPELACDAQSIARAASAGDRAATAALSCYFDALSQSLATVINVVDPDAIVLAGGLSQLPGLIPAVEQRLTQHVFGQDMQTRLLLAKHGDSSGVRGAAWLTRTLLA